MHSKKSLLILLKLKLTLGILDLSSLIISEGTPLKKLIILFCALSCSTSHPMFSGFFGSETKKTPPKPATTIAKPTASSAPANQSTTLTTAHTTGAAVTQAENQQMAPIPLPPIPANTGQAPVIIVHAPINNSPVIHATATNQQSQSNAQASFQANQQTTYQNMMNEIKNVIREQTDSAKNNFISIKEWAELNKKKLIFGCMGAGYIALLAVLIRTNWRISDQNNWSHWRYDESLEELMQIPQKELAHSLVFTIQRRYTTEKQFADFIQPLMHFMHDVEQEKKWLKNYIRIGKILMFSRLHYIVPINQTKINQAEQLLQRVLFFEHVFLSWAAEFKIEQNTKA